MTLKPLSIYILSFLCITLILSNNAKAQNFNDALRLSEPGLGFGTRAIGMGGAFLSISDDYSATFYNPAGLFQVKRMEFNSGLNYSKYINNTEFFVTSSAYDQSKTSLNNIGFIFPFPTKRGSLVFAMGYNKNKIINTALNFSGFNSGNSSMIQSLLGRNDIAYWLYLTDTSGLNTIINGKLLQEGTITSEGSLNSWTVSGAVEIVKNLSLGFSLNVLSGNYERSRNYSESDLLGLYSNLLTDSTDSRTKGFMNFNFTESLKWDLGGFGTKIGFIYKLKEIFNAGITIGFPETYTVKEDYVVNASSKFKTGFSPVLDPEINDKVEYEVTTPWNLGLGISVNIFNFILATDVSFIDFSTMKFDNIKASNLVKKNKEIKELMKAVANINLGLEYVLPPIAELIFRVRGGFNLKPSPFKGDPKDYDKKYYSGGLGVIIDNQVSLDFAYVYGTWKTFGDNYANGNSRTYQEIKTHDLFMTMSYRF